MGWLCQRLCQPQLKTAASGVVSVSVSDGVDWYKAETKRRHGHSVVTSEKHAKKLMQQCAVSLQHLGVDVKMEEAGFTFGTTLEDSVVGKTRPRDDMKKEDDDVRFAGKNGTMSTALCDPIKSGCSQPCRHSLCWSLNGTTL